MTFYDSLTEPEQANLAKYVELKGPDKVYSLNQKADRRPIWSSDAHLQTIIRNCGLLYCPKPGIERWFAPSELMTAMGLPVADRVWQLLDRKPVCSYHVSRDSKGMSARRRAELCKQMGNAMHIGPISACIVYHLVFTRAIYDSPLAQFGRSIPDMASRN